MSITPEAKRILDKRLASGEIDVAEYKELLNVLEGDCPTTSQTFSNNYGSVRFSVFQASDAYKKSKHITVIGLSGLRKLLESGEISGNWKAKDKEKFDERKVDEWLALQKLEQPKMVQPLYHDDSSSSQPSIHDTDYDPISQPEPPLRPREFGTSTSLGDADAVERIYAQAVWMTISAYALFIGMGALFVLFVTAKERPPGVLLAGLGIVGFILLIWGIVNLFRGLYWSWSVIQDGKARTSPAGAVGLLFIPFFSLYWQFVSFWGLARDMNNYIDERKNIKNIWGRPISEGLILTWCILNILYFFFLLALSFDNEPEAALIVQIIYLLISVPLGLAAARQSKNATCAIIRWKHQGDARHEL